MAEDLSESKRYYFYRDQLLAIGAAFAVTLLSIFVLGVITGRRVEQRMSSEYAAAVAKAPPKTQSAGVDSTREAGTGEISVVERSAPELATLTPSDKEAAREHNARKTASEAQSANTPALENGRKGASRPPTAKSGDTAVSAAVQAEPQASQPSKKDSSERVWTVQVKSASEKKFAENWAGRLKAKGYDAFVADADVKGQTWYRVRVGHFAAREEAEALRATLESKEGLSGSFIVTHEPADGAQKTN